VRARSRVHQATARAERGAGGRDTGFMVHANISSEVWS
jgi:hypothetical protein